ncbi:MAG: 4-hydroxy-3-methylbut-2-enyl diphosphate reductase [Bacteroidetes bacterium]|nr:MAG: 4-hydroxy-3-methylbut-2-enyl diphosphate reductase [Bacteroidota bacterium]TAF97459.1 MAG: 4-hydroxy-3-methylbut-2-enyl diphosphate reductase [Bacteroidota bacterium]
MKKFDVPVGYRSNLITHIKNERKAADKLKKDFTPTAVKAGNITFYLARHFGFCYGVENAIEIAFTTIENNPGKRIFLLSEMIHNPQVNADLLAKGVQFLQDPYGKQLISFDTITSDDVVLIPAFGTTLEIEKMLTAKGIAVEKYNTTCPFVEKVWNRGEQIAAKGYSIVIHGKPTHEETRATFSHASANAPSVVVNDMKEAKLLAQFITGEHPAEAFYEVFANRYSPGFDVSKHLQRIGVINQTTQLATDTQAISDYLKQVIQQHYQLSPENLQHHFADTRDTLCYATNDNQSAVIGLLEQPADFAIVVGGYNSSNTSHLVELCEQKLPTYFIDSANKILNSTTLQQTNWQTKEQFLVANYWPAKEQISILVTSGASCPDSVVEAVLRQLLAVHEVTDDLVAQLP